MPKQNKFKLLFATLVIVTGVLKPNYSLAQDLVINYHLIAKKSGGCSSGGSFKSRPSRSSSPKRKSSPRRSNFNQRKSNSPSYRRESVRTYRNSQPRTYRNEMYLVAGFKGQPLKVAKKQRKGRRRRLKGKPGRGTAAQENHRFLA